jgi:hypothetical protein
VVVCGTMTGEGRLLVRLAFGGDGGDEVGEAGVVVELQLVNMNNRLEFEDRETLV